ncbi:MAG: hypothetical protein K0Q72_3834, partial [Armatimonadetes bacterium]|nr:hypothetical protein [Armatimonadota bacterium]
MALAIRTLARLLLGLGLCGAAASCSHKPAAPTTPGWRPVSPLFDPALAHQLLDDPARDRWQKPEQVVRALGLRSGERVADIGAGSGYLLPHLSRAVGPTGQIYAEEVQPAYLPSLRAHAKKLKNVRVVLGTTEDPALPDHRIDCFVLLTVYHEVEKPVTF